MERQKQLPATCYAATHRRDEAIKGFGEARLLARKVFGPEHPNTLRALDQAAMSYFTDRRYEEATKLFEEELPLSRKVLGLEHPNTLQTMHKLANAYRTKGETAKAEALENEIAAVKTKAQPAPPERK